MRVPTMRSLRRVLATSLAVGALASVAAPSAGAGPRDRVDEARRRAAFPVALGFDYGYNNVPKKLAPGTYDFTFVNRSPVEEHELVLFKLDDRNDTVKDVIDAAEDEDEAYFEDFRGVSFAGPLDVQRPEQVEPDFVLGRADLSEPGRYAYLCFIPQVGTGTPHYKLGMVGTLDVK